MRKEDVILEEKLERMLAFSMEAAICSQHPWLAAAVFCWAYCLVDAG